MRRPRFVLTSAFAFAAGGLSALSAPAQPAQRAAYPPGASSSTTAASADPSADAMMASRPARYLLRNGQDYLSYREYDRALNFFRSIENRQKELTDTERQQLRQGIARAQQGKREAVNGPHVVAQPKGRPTDPPGSFALAQTKSARPTTAAPASRPLAPEPVQRTSGTMPTPEPAPVVPAPASAPSLVVASVPSEPAPLDLPTAVGDAPIPVPAGIDGMDLPNLPGTPPAALPDLGSPPPGAAPIPAEPVAAPTAPPELPTLGSVEPGTPPELPTLGSVEPAPTLPPVAADNPAIPPTEATAPPPGADLPTSPDPAAAPTLDGEPAPLPGQAPAPAPVAIPMQDPATVPAQGQPRPAVEPPPAPEATSLPVAVDPAAPGEVAPDRSYPAPVGSLSTSESFLTPRHRAEIERIAQRSSDSPAGDRAAAANPANDPNSTGGLTQGSTRLELLRPPSPTEAQPIRRVPVPEEYVPLGPRDWEARRKYWSAAGTCHTTLYFQDPVLERYGQGVEQALGTRGRFFSYPLDDPKQSNQRNQILQPFYSIGKFCFQVGTLPYKLVVDPPWEAEYDLGYYRPGDKIPKDTIMITPTGVGPPLRGRKY